MPFENIGIGGVLSFDGNQAVRGMQRAARQFFSLRGAADRFQSGLSRVSGALGAFNIAGIGMGAGLGFGLAGLVHSAVSFNAEMETARISIATVLSVARHQPLTDAVNDAQDAFRRLNIIAAETPGEPRDLVNIFRQIAGPLAASGQDMASMLQLTRGVAIASGTLGVQFEDAGHAVAQLAAGNQEMGNDFVRLLHSMGLLTEETSEWRQMLPQDRARRLLEIFNQLGNSGELVGRSWEGTMSTLVGIGKAVLGAFAQPIMNAINERVMGINQAGLAGLDTFTRTAQVLGERIVPIFTFLVNQANRFRERVTGAFDTIRGVLRRVTDLLDRFGMSIDSGVLESMGEWIIQIGATVLAFSPLISIFGALVSAGSVIAGLLGGIAEIASVIAPVLLLAAAGAAAFFAIFREEGEDPIGFLIRMASEVRGLFNTFLTVASPVITQVMSGIQALQDTFGGLFFQVSGSFAGIRGVFESWGQTFFAIIERVRPIITAFIGTIVAGIQGSIAPAFSRMQREGGSAFARISAAIQRFLPHVMPLIQRVFPTLRSVFERVFRVVGAGLEAGAAAVGVFADVFVFALDTIGPVVEFFSPILGGLFDTVLGVVDVIMAAFEAVYNMFQALTLVVRGDFSGALDLIILNFQQLGAAILNFFLTPIRTGLGMVGQIISLLAAAGPALGIDTSGLQRASAQATHFGNNLRFDVGARRPGEGARLQEAGARERRRDSEQSAAAQATRDAQRAQAHARSRTTPAPPEALAREAQVNLNLQQQTRVCMDGRGVSAAHARHQTEIQERAGFNQAPWQRRLIRTAGFQPGGTS